MSQDKAIILMSGGLNSAVAASLAASDYVLAGLHAQFGQPAARIEAEQFQEQADHFDMQRRLVIELSHCDTIRVIAYPSNRPESTPAAESVGQHLPGLMGTLIQAAHCWARILGAKKIFVGASEGPTSPGVPASDIRPDY